MLNVIKADLYRAFKGKGIYITFALFVAFIITQVAAGSIGRIGVITSELVESKTITGSTAAFATMNALDNYLYFMLPIVIIIAAADFSAGTVKNVLSGGMSRAKLLVSKQLLCFAIAFIMLVLNVILSIATATAVNGFGGELNAEFLSDLAKVFVPQALLFLSVVAFLIFIVFATKKTATVIAYFFAFTMVPIMLVYLLSLVWEGALGLLDYELISLMRSISNPKTVTSAQLIQAYVTGAIFLAASTAGSVIIFKRSEIK